MHERSGYPLVHIGLLLRILHKSAGNSAAFTLRQINSLESELTRADFTVSVKGAGAMLAMRPELQAMPEKEKLNEAQVKKLKDEAIRLEKVVFAESSTRQYYSVESRRYNSEFLINAPERMFADDVFLRIPAIGRYDFGEAMKCLAFERPTAAAFHMLRGTEGLLQAVYKRRVRQNRLARPSWGPMVDQLRAITRRPLNIVALDTLDLIRRGYRNPTAHPEAMYSLAEAEDLLGLCIDVVNKISTEVAT
jgi:hypothetical protein